MSLNPQDIGNGEEQHEFFTTKRPGKPAVKRCQYDYRHTNGKLFSCVALSLDAAREKRDGWLLGMSRCDAQEA